MNLAHNAENPKAIKACVYKKYPELKKGIVYHVEKINSYGKIKGIVNHPLSKAVALSFIGAMLLLERHLLYAGIAFGMSLRELLLAFKEN